MRISVRWLKELVDYPQATGDLAKRLNNAGLEVAGIDVYGRPPFAEGLTLPDGHLDWAGIAVGEVLDVKPHPNADRLRIAVVDFGQGPAQSVTGAPNLTADGAGRKVAVAAPGARLNNAHGETPGAIQVKPAKLRGEASNVVLCSERELGVSQAHEGIIFLDPDAPVGAPLSDVLGDVVLDVELTPNLARCLNMVGVAREVAALCGGTLRLEAPQWQADGPPIRDRVSIEIEDPQRCARYTAALIEGIQLGPSPYWMQYRLTLAGMRPISNIVDITNYVMLEWGQPLHAFDYDTLRPRNGGPAPAILVRSARPGERLTTLDGTDRALDPDMLLITDGRGPIALAGVMGGEDTEVSEKTRSILLESANFDPAGNRRTAQALKLFSEASGRFSKGLPPSLAEHGLKRAADLMRQLAGGTVSEGLVDVYPLRPEPRTILLPSGEATRLLGVALDAAQVCGLLAPLGFDCRIDGDHIQVTVPEHRLDVALPADLVEEVARMIGYDELPSRLLAEALPPQRPNPALAGKLRVKRALTQLGLQEVITYTLTNPDWLQRLDPQRRAVDPANFVRLANTLSSERSLLRRSLLSTLLESVARNTRFQERVAVFEIGHVYLPDARTAADEGLPAEPNVLGVALCGARAPSSWLGPAGELDFFDLKGLLQALLRALGVGAARSLPATDDRFHPGRCARWEVDGASLGVFGELHPRVAEAVDVEGRLCAAEFDLDRLLAAARPVPEFVSPPRYPAVSQDIALVLDGAVPNERVEDLIAELGRPLLTQLRLFDVYTGEHVPAGKRSLAYSLTYQAADRTLTDDEVARTHGTIQQGLRDNLGAEIRGLD